MPVSVGVIWPEALAADEPLPDIAGLARVAEQAGLDGIWASDRLVRDEMNVLDAGPDGCTLAWAWAAVPSASTTCPSTGPGSGSWPGRPRRWPTR
jgi:alkanesulfonate monooxygenase SsuD/methylene tetrahydromethanopterin reductase-like flavin-dependent oxidoreductase (luciferase family)